MNMASGAAANTALLEGMVRVLGEVADDLVFVGGCATDLLVTSVRPDYVRATTDVDVVAEVTTIHEYHALEKRIAAKGFKHDPEVVCRWRVAGLQLDVMPSGSGVLGFQNHWYPLAVATAAPYVLPSSRTIRLVSGPLFLATKLEAFRDRGGGDYVASHDLEDIVHFSTTRPYAGRCREPSAPASHPRKAASTCKGLTTTEPRRHDRHIELTTASHGVGSTSPSARRALFPVAARSRIRARRDAL